VDRRGREGQDDESNCVMQNSIIWSWIDKHMRVTTVRSKSRCALRLRYVDLLVRIEVAVEVCCCLTVFSC
jgi:hypothetical protein